MTVLMFHERFAAPILAGTKRQTIRPLRKRPIKAGDSLSLRKWEGVAYRSPQVELKAVKCSAVWTIDLNRNGIVMHMSVAGGGGYIATNELERLDEFARGDGFESWADMKAYLTAPGGYGLPFTGILIQWE